MDKIYDQREEQHKLRKKPEWKEVVVKTKAPFCPECEKRLHEVTDKDYRTMCHFTCTCGYKY